MPTRVHTVKAMDFPIVMYGCESWTIKKAECQRTDAFKLWCWRWLLRAPWTARRSNQPILKKINPEYSLEGLMLKLKFQILGPPDAKSWLIGKDPNTGRDWRHAEKGTTEDEMVGWHHWPNGHELEQTPGDGEEQGTLSAAAPGVTKSQTQLSDWPTTHASKAMLKVLHVKLQHYANHELPNVQASFKRGRGTRDQIPNIH